jgi:hypothetical protein
MIDHMPLPPQFFKPCRIGGGVPDGVLNIAVFKIVLNEPGVRAMVRHGKPVGLPTLATHAILLSKRRQSFPVDKIKKALRGSARLFLTLFPLLHRRLAYAKDCGKDGLADLVGLPDAPDVLGLKRAQPGQTQSGKLAHGDFVHGSNLKQVLRHFVGNI